MVPRHAGCCGYFIAQAYGIDLTPSALATVVATATVASIGTAGVPSVGLVTLSMVLTSVGLPTEGIALIMGIDRILDHAQNRSQHHRRCSMYYHHCQTAGRI